jgi:hypothetical protein
MQHTYTKVHTWKYPELSLKSWSTADDTATEIKHSVAVWSEQTESLAPATALAESMLD